MNQLSASLTEESLQKNMNVGLEGQVTYCLFEKSRQQNKEAWRLELMKEHSMSEGHYAKDVVGKCQKIKLGRRIGASLYMVPSIGKRRAN